MSGGPGSSCDHRTAVELKLQVVSESFSISLNLLDIFDYVKSLDLVEV